MRTLLRLIAALLFFTIPASAQAPKRVALIIANANYAGYRQLPNAAVDAGLVSAGLQRAGFVVERAADLGIADFRTALGRFQSRAAGAEVALVYFAGHGIEAGGKNWLIPADARLTTDAELDFQAIEANLVIRAASGASARIVVLDACRDNPFAGRMRSTGVYRVTRAGGGGLSALDVQSARGTLLMYSAASGEVANDGAPGQGSPFARAFARWMPEPGIELRVAVGRIADAVYAETGAAQLPFTTTSLSGSEIYLVSGARTPAPDPEVERLRRENEALRTRPPPPAGPPASSPTSASEPARPSAGNLPDAQGQTTQFGSPVGPGAWRLEVVRDAMTDNARATTILLSEARNAALIIRCENGGRTKRVALGVEFDAYLGFSTEPVQQAMMRFDQNPPQTLNWFYNDKIIEMGDQRRAATIVAQIRSARRVVVRALKWDTPVHKAVEADFDVAGAREAIEATYAACSMSPPP